VVNASDFLLIRGLYFVRPDLPAPVGGEGVGIVIDAGEQVDRALIGKRVIVLPTWAYGTWSQQVVASQHNVLEVPDANPLQLAMLPINPPTAHLLLNRFVDLKAGDWVGQTGGNSAVGRYLVALAKLRGLKTLNLVRRDEAAEEVRDAGGDVVLIDWPHLAADIGRGLDGQRLSLVVDPLGGGAAAQLIGALHFGGTAVSYGSLTGTPRRCRSSTCCCARSAIPASDWATGIRPRRDRRSWTRCPILADWSPTANCMCPSRRPTTCSITARRSSMRRRPSAPGRSCSPSTDPNRSRPGGIHWSHGGGNQQRPKEGARR
jgi:NADPH:quinone reductase-like Zn-dependent oxidoreductase